MAFRWRRNIECCLGSLVILQGSRPVLLRHPIYFNLKGKGLDLLPPPPINPRMRSHYEQRQTDGTDYENTAFFHNALM